MSGPRPRPRAVVLLSGGLDSATTLALAVAQGFEAFALTLDYGQRHALEVARARILAPALGAAAHRVVAVDLAFGAGCALTDPATPVPKGRAAEDIGRGIPATYVPARNTVLLALGLAWAESLGADDLFLGVNAVDYSGYPDCRPEFLRAFEELAARGTRRGAEGGRFTIHAPLLHWGKAEIVRRAVEVGVDPALTLSCYDPDAAGRPCGACDACQLRAKGFRDAGIEDRAAVKRTSGD